MIRCEACRGHKQVMKLGMVRGDCDVCEGKGKVEAEQEITAKALIQKADVEVSELAYQNISKLESEPKKLIKDDKQNDKGKTAQGKGISTKGR